MIICKNVRKKVRLVVVFAYLLLTIPFCRHAIPSNPKVKRIWIERIQNPKLFNVEDSRHLKNYTVCEEHFEDTCKVADGKLKKFSLPTLHLPGNVNILPKSMCIYKKVIFLISRIHFGWSD